MALRLLRKRSPFTGFTVQMYMENLGLHHYKARAYHAGLGRFLQTDPIGYGDGMNMYAYVGNDPVNNVDPLGLEQCPTEICAYGKSPGDPWEDFYGGSLWYDWRDYYENAYDIDDNGGGGRGADADENNEGQCSGNEDPNCSKKSTATALIPSSEVRFLPGHYCYQNPMCSGQANDASWILTLPVAGTTVGGRFIYSFAKTGRELKFGKNFRIAPFGNRTGHPTGRYPHYHRRGIDRVTGQTRDGQGITRHRPWDTKTPDRSIWDRF